jgi:putative ABC transport system permease protein
MKFIEGNAETSLVAPNSAVLSRQYANIMFGSPEAAMNQVFKCRRYDCVISGVVEDLPQNSHFSFDILIAMKTNARLDNYGGCEFYTYYLIQKEASLQTVRAGIESEYNNLLKPWAKGTGQEGAFGQTEMLSDVYFSTKAGVGFGVSGSMLFIRILAGLAFLILLLAVTNFINLFVTQGEMRMLEIGIRKTNGAQVTDIIRQFFSEVSIVVLIAFVIGFFLAILCIPYFSDLIQKNLDIRQLLSPTFILSILLLLGITIVLSALYPAI